MQTDFPFFLYIRIKKLVSVLFNNRLGGGFFLKYLLTNILITNLIVLSISDIRYPYLNPVRKELFESY